ncbi:ROK family protein [Kineosporia rhizophila]|uniref:ROK family protein n=1 Tax=Kineosporia TaxID=49184 RepID=UPI001E285DC3|nr:MULTISPECIES: ROK family protein [Kineosporia]MCE0537365.1 ROK family protein [Kineosporia rhizophila]GLY17488.1 sugar kinase [Kineosporia sp. NBRC 101677]
MNGLSDAGAPAVGIDVGGTSVKGVLLGADGSVLAVHRLPTPAPAPDGRAVVETVGQVRDALAGDQLLPVGVAVPGVVDEADGLAVYSANLGWRDLPLGELLEKRLGSGVVLTHDVRAGGVAEARTGAAAGRDGVMAFVPVGTGVAAAVLIDGQPLVSGGWAGEIGQLLITQGEFAGQRVEEVASARATALRAGMASAREVAASAGRGSTVAQQVWKETITVLADALAGLSATVAPSVIVIGGGLALAGRQLIAPLSEELTRRLPGLRVPEVLPAGHGDAAAAVGAALLGLEGRS